LTSIFDPRTIDELRALPAAEAFARVRKALYEGGATMSADFHEAYEELVELGILTWDQVEEFDR